MTSLSLSSRDGGNGVVVRDPIERRRCEFVTEGPVQLEDAPTDVCSAPIDVAATIRTSSIELPEFVATHVRDTDGALVDRLGHFDSCSVPTGGHEVELDAAIKLYLRFDARCEVTAAGNAITLTFDDEATVAIGARSYHQRPAFTLTTTREPADMMRVVSYLGSALKTTSSERSFPTLRGHPPAIELGDRVEIPDGIEPPQTGVTLELPATCANVFAAAPLAYYLGADVVPGTQPRLVTDRGFVYPLDTPSTERAIERVLKQVFFLDCLTRTEGLYPVTLHEREALEDLLDWDFAELYDQPIAEQLETYLSVPFESLEAQMPDWKLTSHVAPDPENVETVPFLVDDLAVIRSPNATRVTRSEAQSEAIKAFMRDAPTRSTSAAPSSSPALVQPEAADSLEQSWVGDDAPIGASKSTTQAFRNRLARDASDGDINITVVCNDPQMLEEHEDVSAVYGSRENLPFDVTLYEDLTTDRLQFVLESDMDYFHYIGHIEDGGFKCDDGLLDVRDLDTVGVDAFFLNACSSYTQGMALVERGAIGGVVTLDDVINSGAVRVGRTMARLLNRGFPMGSALDLAKDRSIVGAQYIVLGDSGFEVAQSEGNLPLVCLIESVDDGFEVSLKTYALREQGIGSMHYPALGDEDRAFLCSGTTPSVSMNRDELEEFLTLDDVPTRCNGEFLWSSELTF